MKSRKYLLDTVFILLMILPCRLQCNAQQEGGEWYKGDLHSHSNYSDGDSSVAAVLANAESLGLDFFALTDHDTIMNGEPAHWFDPDFHSEKMVLLYGVEWTSDMGHGNIWGSTPFSYGTLWEANLANDALAAAEAAHDQGALFSINHPTAFLCCPWKYQVYDAIDTIEVWNSMYRFPNFSRLAVHQFWDTVLLSGRRIPAVGGSDTHHLLEWQSQFFGHGNPTTWVYAEEFSPSGILAGIKEGHTTISYGPSSVRLDFTADADGDGNYEILVGDTIALQPGEEITFRVRIVCPTENKAAAERTDFEPVLLSPAETSGGNEKPGAELPFFLAGNGENCSALYGLTVFKNGSTFKTRLASGLRDITFSDSVETSLPAYYRVELYGMPREIPLYRALYGIQVALTNPIYVNY